MKSSRLYGGEKNWNAPFIIALGEMEKGGIVGNRYFIKDEERGERGSYSISMYRHGEAVYKKRELVLFASLCDYQRGKKRNCSFVFDPRKKKKGGRKMHAST